VGTCYIMLSVILVLVIFACHIGCTSLTTHTSRSRFHKLLA